MKISFFCIERPVFSTVISLLIVFTGVVSLFYLSVREYPNIDEPVVSVKTNFKGAAPAIIESQITKPLEDSIAGIEGIKTLSSTSRSERSQITVRFHTYRDPDDAASDVRDRVSRVRSRLPLEAEESRISKVEADASPIIWLALYSDELSLMDLSFLAKNVVKPRLQTFPGTADVRIYGDRNYAMRVWVDRDKLISYGLTVQHIERAIRQQNLEIPAGRIETPGKEFTVIAATELTSPEEFKKIVLNDGTKEGFVRLGDVATVELGPEDERRVARYKGRPAIALGIIKQATANPLLLSQALSENLSSVLKDLPSSVGLEIAADYSIFIDRSINAVFKTILEAMVLVALVILLVLQSLKAACIPLVTIPISLIGMFSILLAFAFSINTLTLLAMVVAVGLVVDDAIVVLENTSRYLDKGYKKVDAAKKAISEVGFPVIAMTLTLAAVFTPIIFAPGRIGRLFEEFALSLVGAVLISGFVALTLTPVMCAYMLDEKKKTGKEKSVEVGTFQVFKNACASVMSVAAGSYLKILNFVLTRNKTILFTLIIVVGFGVLSFSATKKELSPVEDRGLILVVFSAPEGSSLGYTNTNSMLIEDQLVKIKEADKYFVISGSPTINKGAAFFRPVPWENRERSIQEIVGELQPGLLSMPGIRAFALLPPAFGQRARSRPIQLVILSSGSIQNLEEIGNKIVSKLSETSLLNGIESDLVLNKPEIKLSINRDLAADLGVKVEDIGRTLESLLGGRFVTRFKKGNEQYEVIVQLVSEGRENPRDIRSIYVEGEKEELHPLSSLVDLEETVGPRELNHFSQRRAVKISAGLAPGVTIDEALSSVEQIARDNLPENAQIDFDGQSREYFEAKNTLFFVFILSIVFIFLVLSAQFESFAQPIAILVTVPLALSGAVATIFLLGGSINVYSQIGLIALVGLITKHGILIVEFGNQCLAKGMSLKESVLEAASLRFRPILMTTISTICGAMPLALASGPGSEAREQIGWIIVGGMSIGTILTLFVLPTIFLWVNECVMLFSTRKQPD